MFGLIKKMFIGLLTSLVVMPLATQKVYYKVIKNMRFNLLLFNYILMNTAKNFTAIHLQLNKTNVLEVVIISVTYLIKYMF